MQTFLPYADFRKSAKTLDNQRLNKQIVECYQVLRACRGETKGWVNHPITKAWKDHETSLAKFGLVCCEEYKIKTGKEHACKEKIEVYFVGEEKLPVWFGDIRIHSQYRANLLYKNIEWYNRFDWEEKANGSRYYPLENGKIDIRR